MTGLRAPAEMDDSLKINIKPKDNFPFLLDPDFRLHVSVFYRDTLVREVTTSSSEGCHITPCLPEEKHYQQPGRPEVIPLPVDCLSAQRRSDECPPSPPSTLERGVLVWMGADGLYARRQCQSRVYWQGGLSPYGDKPNKLEREVITKLFHTQDYLTGEDGLTSKLISNPKQFIRNHKNQVFSRKTSVRSEYLKAGALSLISLIKLTCASAQIQKVSYNTNNSTGSSLPLFFDSHN